MYHKLFDDAIKKYNAKQKRKDRQIKNYYDKIARSKQEKLFYGVIVQIGNRDDTGVGSNVADVAVKVLTDKKEQLADLQAALERAHVVFDKADEELERARVELAEVKKLRNELIAQGDGDYYLREEVIRLRYENQNLKAENKGLREILDKAYEFMKKFVIEGKSMLDKFFEWIGEKVRDVRGK